MCAASKIQRVRGRNLLRRGPLLPDVAVGHVAFGRFSRSPQGRRAVSGMTLIEVLIAIAILGLALVVMLTAISRCLAVLRVSDRYHKAMWALSMGEAEHPLLLEQGGEPHDLEVPGTVYDGITYVRQIEDPDEDAPDAALRLLRVTTTLEWAGRGATQRITVPQYLLFRE